MNISENEENEVEKLRAKVLPRVEAFLRNRRIDQSFAEDLVQKGLMSFVNREGSFEEIKYPINYVFQICRRIFLREAQNNKIFRDYIADIKLVDLDSRTAYYDDVLGRLERQLMMREVFAHANTLEKLIIDEILLSDDKGFSIRKIVRSLQEKYPEMELTRYAINEVIKHLRKKISQ